MIDLGQAASKHPAPYYAVGSVCTGKSIVPASTCCSEWVKRQKGNTS